MPSLRPEISVRINSGEGEAAFSLEGDDAVSLLRFISETYPALSNEDQSPAFEDWIQYMTDNGTPEN